MKTWNINCARRISSIPPNMSILIAIDCRVVLHAFKTQQILLENRRKSHVNFKLAVQSVFRSHAICLSTLYK